MLSRRSSEIQGPTFEPSSALSCRLPSTAIPPMPITTSLASRYLNLSLSGRSSRPYGISLEDVFRSIDLSIATFRRSISTVIPKMTRVALLTRKAELVKEDHSFTRKKFFVQLEAG